LHSAHSHSLAHSLQCCEFVSVAWLPAISRSHRDK
jgi:hypothetical protein